MLTELGYKILVEEHRKREARRKVRLQIIREVAWMLIIAAILCFTWLLATIAYR